MPSPTEQEAAKAFIVELAELSQKHGIVIGGCGCCDSPYLSYNEGKAGSYTIDDTLGYLTFVEK